MDSKIQNLLGQLLNKSVEYLHNDGIFQSGVEFALVSILISEEVGQVDHPDFTLSFTHLDIFYCDQGKYDKAEPLYQQVLTIYEKALGPGHCDDSGRVN